MTRVGRVVPALLVVLAVVVMGRPAVAIKSKPAPSPVAGQVQALTGQVNEVAAEEATLLAQLDASKGRLDDLNAKLAALDREQVPVQAALQGAQGRLDDVSARQLVAEGQLADTRGLLADAQQRMVDQAIAAYMGESGSARYVDLLLRARSIGDLTAATAYVRSALDADQAVVTRFGQLRNQVSGLRTSLDHDRSSALDVRDVVASQEQDLADRRQAEDAVRQQVAAEVATQNYLLGQLQARKAEFQAQLDALQHQSDSLAAQLRGRQSGQAPTPSGHGVLAVPIPGAPVTSPFGPRVDPIYGDIRFHTGVDFGAPYGTPIQAAADGVVVSAGPLGGYGNATVIDHGNGLATVYGHQSSIAVSPGQSVRRGQVVGYVGCTGLCTGPHLHFEVRVDGTPVDPMQYL
ncbi:MAG: peptidoglycan DD-metalloendopeptidase family protein [Acidimicrobiia bacterium]|nr:peptidoglycan DD-metalloendopeptidase family protein [Acidimicrobiia bacterium]